MSGAQLASQLDARWRERARAAQVAALPPPGTVAVSCSAPLDVGGLGRHASEILDALGRGGHSASCICQSTRERSRNGGSGGPADPHLLLRAAARIPGPVPQSVRTRAFLVEFDAYAARHLPASQHLIAFNSQSLKQLRRARHSGYDTTTLVSANPHLRRLAHQHELAHRAYPLETSWAKQLLARNLAEYRLADRIHVASHYIRESFLAEGFPPERLVDFPLTPHPRFAPAPAGTQPGDQPSSGADSASDLFEVVFVGSLSVHKGVPLLIDAFRRLPYADARLVLVGGWGTRGMRRFVQRALAGDPRIAVRPGDPLPVLRRARLYVHPAYEDGFGYAPAEALAAGVPVIVSEDTGMKELIDAPRNGFVVPTGELGALTEAIAAAYRGELFGP